MSARSGAVSVFSIAFFAWLLTNIDQSLFGYAIPLIRQEFDIGLDAIGLIISLSFVAGMIIPIAVGTLTDRWGARWTLALCLAVSALLVGVQGVTTGLYSLAVARILGFGFSAALSPITNTMVVGAVPPRSSPMAVALLQCAYPLGWFVSSLLAAPLIVEVGWRWLFCVGFLVAPAALLFGFLIPAKSADREQDAGSPPAHPRPFAALFSPTHRRTALLCGAAFFFNSGAVAATAFYLPTFLHEVRGYSVGDSALLVGSSYGISVIGYIGSALVSLYLLNRRDTIALWNVLAAGLFLAMIWLPRSFAEDFAAFGLMAVFFYGTTAILITYLLEAFPPGLRATAAAVSGTACVSFSMIVFPVLTARAVDAIGWQLSFSVIVPPALLVSGLVMLALPRSSSVYSSAHGVFPVPETRR